MTAGFDVASVVAVFENLHAYVLGEPSLAAFSAVSAELLTQARRIAAGDFDVQVVERCGAPDHLPSDDAARRFIEIMAPLPPLEPAEAPDLAAAYAKLLGGLAGNITYLIYRDFPDLAPRRA